MVGSLTVFYSSLLVEAGREADKDGRDISEG